jgi:RNA polymerase sigma-B factor
VAIDAPQFGLPSSRTPGYTDSARQRDDRPATVRSPLHQVAPEELFRRWQCERDPAARDELFERFSPLARALASRYLVGAREPLEDLVQVASLGLLNAIDRFDTDRGIAFSSYAVPTILGELKRYFRDAGWALHVPRGAKEAALKVRQAKEELSSERHSPTVQEIAEHLDWSVERVLDGLEAAAAHHPVSLEVPSADRESDDDAPTLADTLGGDDPGFAKTEEIVTAADAMRSLSNREQQILALRYFGDLAQTEISNRIGISQMQVSRTLRRTIDELRRLTGAIESGEEPGDSNSASQQISLPAIGRGGTSLQD